MSISFDNSLMLVINLTIIFSIIGLTVATTINLLPKLPKTGICFAIVVIGFSVINFVGVIHDGSVFGVVLSWSNILFAGALVLVEKETYAFAKSNLAELMERNSELNLFK